MNPFRRPANGSISITMDVFTRCKNAEEKLARLQAMTEEFMQRSRKLPEDHPLRAQLLEVFQMYLDALEGTR
jgi:hypothetical protein